MPRTAEPTVLAFLLRPSGVASSMSRDAGRHPNPELGCHRRGVSVAHVVRPRYECMRRNARFTLISIERSMSNGAKSPHADAFNSLFLSYRPTARVRPGFTPMALAAGTGAKPFSFFRSADLARATALGNEFDKIAGPKPSKRSLQKVMERFHEVADDNVQLAQWALRLFIARRPGGDILPMPTLRQQLAQHLRESPHLFANLMALTAKGPPSPEDTLNYFRHDIDLSDHHLHWHLLYSHGAPKNPALQGQLFLYMHQQCLARYDTERHVSGLPLVESFLQWDDPLGRNSFIDKALPIDSLAPWIAAAIPPGQYTDFNEGGQSPRDLDQNDVDFTLNLLRTIASRVKQAAYADYNTLGTDLEANKTSKLDPDGPHNVGHGAMSSVPNSSVPTVMSSPEVAMTTPVFYRWHRAIDDYGFQWQELQAPFSWNYVTPTVRIRRRLDGGNSTNSPDVIITLRSAIPGIDQPQFDLEAFGESKFGGPKFDVPADASLNTDILRTSMVADNEMGENRLQLVDHWVYFFRLSNASAQDAGVTVRIWLAHRDLSASRRHWIEMDKFVVVVPKKGKKVVSRPGWHSTVIRGKAWGT